MRYFWRPLRLILGFTLSVCTLFNAAHAQVMIGAYIPGDAWDVSEIKAFNKASEKDMAFVTIFSAFTHNWKEQLHWQSGNIYNNAAIPLITWMPVDMKDPERNLLPEIVAGQWDDYIDEWIDGFIAWIDSYPAYKKPIAMLRFAHEFNGSWYPYSDEPETYVKAWRHIHERFAATRANDYMEWVWSANHINFDSHDDMTLYYPGDAYVDWTSLDGYNWGTNHDWTEWDSFDDMFSASYATLVENYPEKPIVIAEYAVTEPNDQPSVEWMQFGDDSDRNENRSRWFSQTLQTVEEHYPAIRGLGLFNLDKELSWSLTKGTSTGLRGYNTGIKSDHYTSRFLGARLMVLGAAMDEETIRKLAEPEPVYDIGIYEKHEDLHNAKRMYFSTDRLRTKTVRRELIDMGAHVAQASKQIPDEDTISAAKLKAKNYREKFIKQSQNKRRGMKRMQMLNY